MTREADYLKGRKVYSRPQAMLWSENPGSLLTTAAGVPIYTPTGYEVGSSYGSSSPSFIILSDDGRQPIDFKSNRIERRERMINGRMRSYHIADKLTISTSWNLLPSRAFRDGSGAFDITTGLPTNTDDFTSDNGAGGVDMLDWYENHTGSFYVFLAYDKYSNFGSENDTDSYAHLGEYNQVIEMYISDFSYTVVKRGGRNLDLWNISLTLEEV